MTLSTTRKTAHAARQPRQALVRPRAIRAPEEIRPALQLEPPARPRDRWLDSLEFNLTW